MVSPSLRKDEFLQSGTLVSFGLKMRTEGRNIPPVTNGNAKPAEPLPVSIPFKNWFWGNVFDLLRSNGRFALVCAVIAFCAYEVSVSVRSFAGQISIASITLKVLANVVVKWSITISVSGLSIALYFRERNQHRETRKRLASRIAELEIRLDPNRTSSQLTTEGLTRKEDE
jgi:hypothetical protein